MSRAHHPRDASSQGHKVQGHNVSVSLRTSPFTLLAFFQVVIVNHTRKRGQVLFELVYETDLQGKGQKEGEFNGGRGMDFLDFFKHWYFI
jgi:hypothetical protein